MGKLQTLNKTKPTANRAIRSKTNANQPPHPLRQSSPASGTPLTSHVQVQAVRQKLGISQEELARVTGYSTRSIAGWEAGRPVSISARQKLTETDRLRNALAQIVGPGQLGQWLRTPNPAFEGQTPIQLIERGESDRLWRMIHQINANVAE